VTTEPDITSNSDFVADTVRIRRAADRASYDRAVINEIIDAALVGHVGTVRDGKPLVIPMFCVRRDDWLLMHGAPASGVIRRAQTPAGEPLDVCVTITLLDGLVLARSSFHHSMNYRSVVVVGRALPITEPEAKAAALEYFTERLVPGRQAELRPTTAKEAQGTSVLQLSLNNASAKIRTGPPIDDEEDYGVDVWAGVVPVTTRLGAPEPDPLLKAGIDLPDNVAALVGRRL
jgi:nitroimidazol reductase NimA-like FMN-containing flavoprotein (pyridoxamine 5'-phosphate oxidase superfamily)